VTASSDLSTAVPFPASRGWTRRGHRVGVVETPTGDVDLNTVSPEASEVSQNIASPSVHSRRLQEDSSSSLQKKSLQTSPKRHTGRDRLSDVRAAILASAAAKLSSTTAQLNNNSLDCLRAGKSSTTSSSGSDSPRSPGTVECSSVGRVISVDSGTDTASDDSSRLLKQSDEQSSESTLSSSSGQTEGSLTAQKPPTGRVLVESSRLTKQADRKSFDKPSSFFRSLLTRPRTGSPVCANANASSSPAAGKSARPNDLSLQNSLTQGQHSASGSGETLSRSAVLPPQSSPHYFSFASFESPKGNVSVGNSVSKSFSSSVSSGTGFLYAANNHQSHSLLSKSEPENSTLPGDPSDYQGEKLFKRDTVTASIFLTDIGKNSAHVDFASPTNQGPAARELSASDQRLHSTAELVISTTSDTKPDIKRPAHLLSVDASPSQGRKIRKVVTFAEERNTGISSFPLGSAYVEFSTTMNGEVQLESEKPTNNNPTSVSRLTTSESVPGKDEVVAQSNISSDVSNANTIQSNDEVTTAALGSSNFVANVWRDLSQESTLTASAWLNNTHKSAVVVNGHEANDVPATEADDSASIISDLDSEDLSASQQDLHTLYQQRRAERLQEQKAAELEKQRLEEILKLCTEFGLSSDIPSSLLASEDGSTATEKVECRNSQGRIKTNGSLTKVAGLLPTEMSSVVERQLNQSGSGSNSDDDIDRGTIRRRPIATKKLADTSAVTASLKNTLPSTTISSRTALDNDRASRTILSRTGSGTLPTVGLSVEAAGRSKSVPMIDTNAALGEGDLEQLLQSNIGFSLPTAADWRVGLTNNPSSVKSSLDWYSTSLPEYSSIWDSVNSWKSSHHRVRIRYIDVLS